MKVFLTSLLLLSFSVIAHPQIPPEDVSKLRAELTAAREEISQATRLPDPPRDKP